MEATIGKGYEFDESGARLLDELGGAMNTVGFLLFLLGAASLALAAVFVLGGPLAAAGPGLHGATAMVIGGWTRSAAASFRRIAATEGDDVAHLVGALVDLRKIYALQRTVLIVSVVLVGLLTVIAPLLLVLQ